MWESLKDKLVLGKLVNREEMIVWGLSILGLSLLVDFLLK
tara:strand:- start:233 stop:352 length:120 start_codon:yes stop_codon:yes gene_type:complete